MQPSRNTVLITGGATGIGLALAKKFVAEGNTVLICGRRAEALAQAKAEVPQLHTFVADVSVADDRKRLAEWAVTEHPGLNVLVNNAGIQHIVNLRKGLVELEANSGEIATNLEGVIYMTGLLLPHLLKMDKAAVVNISSGLALVPMAAMPIYCATKAALHSYTRSLRYQLKETNMKVFNVLPPVVKTDLHKGHSPEGRKAPSMIEPEEVATQFWKAWLADKEHVPVGMVKLLQRMNRLVPDFIFEKMSGLMKV